MEMKSRVKMRRMLMTAATALFWHSMEISVADRSKSGCRDYDADAGGEYQPRRGVKGAHQRETYCKGDSQVDDAHDHACCSADDQIRQIDRRPCMSDDKFVPDRTVTVFCSKEKADKR